MYLGRAVEKGPKEALFAAPHHPYTVALLRPRRRRSDGDQKRIKLEGELPSPLAVPDGCPLPRAAGRPATAAAPKRRDSERDLPPRPAFILNTRTDTAASGLETALRP